MRVLVTGHLGYIGTILTPMLLGRGHDVVGFDSDLYGRCTFGPASGIAHVPNIRKDIRDAEITDVSGFDAIIHLAGLSNDPLGDLNPELTFSINHRASVRLAELARKAGVERFLFSSSCSNYGAAGDDLLDENATFNPVTPYGRSKVMVERDVSQLADAGFSPVFLRNATAYGVSPRLRFDLVLNNLVAWACATGHVMIKSDGSPWRPIVHIRDISRAFIACLECDRALVHNRAFNVCATSENYRVRDIAQIVARTVPQSTVTFADGASPDKRNYRVRGDLFCSSFQGFQPQWTAERGAEELYMALRDGAVTEQDFEGPRFKRVAHIKSLIESGAIDEDLRIRAAAAAA
jgi:nucleoside-diphosphate-sugar epimerase